MTTGWTINGVKEAIAGKKISARELTAQHYKRIGEKNREVNAFLTLCEERAYAQAERIDADVAAGRPLPALAGVPIAVKDVIVTRGLRTTCGSKIAGELCSALRCYGGDPVGAGGGVILGKTNCDEFAMGSSNENSAFGPVRNPVALGIACRAGRAADRRRWWRRGRQWFRWGRTRADRSGSRLRFAGLAG